MKFLSILTLFGILALLYPYAAHAEIIQGNASSDVTVNNSVQGSGEVHTHIESTVNGKTKVLDSNKPGTYTLHNSSSSSTQSAKPTPTAKPTEKPNPHKQDPDPILALENYFHELIQKILSAFRV